MWGRGPPWSESGVLDEALDQLFCTPSPHNQGQNEESRVQCSEPETQCSDIEAMATELLHGAASAEECSGSEPIDASSSHSADGPSEDVDYSDEPLRIVLRRMVSQLQSTNLWPQVLRNLERLSYIHDLLGGTLTKASGRTF